MTDYKNMRLKKNADLLNAMANVRKDLYDWKPPVESKQYTNRNIKSPLQRLSPLFDKNSTNGTPNSTFRSNSLKDLSRNFNSEGGKHSLTALSTTKSNATDKLRPFASAKLEKVNTMKNNVLINTSDDSLQQQQLNDRVYLNSVRNVKKSSLNEIENDIVIFCIILRINLIKKY